MKKKSKMKSKQKQKQKQKQSVVINIDNSRKSIKRDKKESQPKQQQPTIIPQPIYVPQFNYTPPPQPQVPERQAFRQEPERSPAFNPQPLTQQINPATPNINMLRTRRNRYFAGSDEMEPENLSNIVVSSTPQQERSFVTNPPVETNKKHFSPASNPPSLLVSSLKKVERINNPSRSVADDEEETRDLFANVPAVAPDDISVSELPDTPVRNPTTLSSTCVEIVQSGNRKGQVCGKKCLPNSAFCGLHKNSSLDFTRPMERFLRK